MSGVESVSDIEVIRGELWVADRTSTRHGIRIFRIADDTELTPAPIDIGMPPSDIVFLW